ncbi:MAG: complexin-2 [Lachnospiraceae bacterium]
MKKEKQIQIPVTLFTELCQYFLIEDADPERKKSIKKGLAYKLDPNINHEIYTQYKTSATTEQREKARKEYLDRVGISENFRW